MRKFISILLVFCSLSLMNSCKKEVDRNGAQLIDENALPEYPVDKLRFKWRGELGVEQKLMMWIEWYKFDVHTLEEPNIFQIGIPKNYSPQDGNLFVYETDIWEPIFAGRYYWKVLTYYSDGEVVESDTREFVPFPPL